MQLTGRQSTNIVDQRDWSRARQFGYNNANLLGTTFMEPGEEETKRLRESLGLSAEPPVFEYTPPVAPLNPNPPMYNFAGTGLSSMPQQSVEQQAIAAVTAALASGMTPESLGLTTADVAPLGFSQPSGGPLGVPSEFSPTINDASGVPSFASSPAPGSVKTSNFGMRTHPNLGYERMHYGTDVAYPGGKMASMGKPALAADAGTVTFAGQASGYGNRIVVDHGGGVETTYNHLGSIGAAVGDEIGAGDQLGEIGNTGLGTGSHLHFEKRVDGQYVNAWGELQNTPTQAPLPDMQVQVEAGAQFDEIAGQPGEIGSAGLGIESGLLATAQRPYGTPESFTAPQTPGVAPGVYERPTVDQMLMTGFAAPAGPDQVITSSGVLPQPGGPLTGAGFALPDQSFASTGSFAPPIAGPFTGSAVAAPGGDPGGPPLYGEGAFSMPASAWHAGSDVATVPEDRFTLATAGQDQSIPPALAYAVMQRDNPFDPSMSVTGGPPPITPASYGATPAMSAPLDVSATGGPVDDPFATVGMTPASSAPFDVTASGGVSAMPYAASGAIPSGMFAPTSMAAGASLAPPQPSSVDAILSDINAPITGSGAGFTDPSYSAYGAAPVMNGQMTGSASPIVDPSYSAFGTAPLTSPVPSAWGVGSDVATAPEDRMLSGFGASTDLSVPPGLAYAVMQRDDPFNPTMSVTGAAPPVTPAPYGEVTGTAPPMSEPLDVMATGGLAATPYTASGTMSPGSYDPTLMAAGIAQPSAVDAILAETDALSAGAPLTGTSSGFTDPSFYASGASPVVTGSMTGAAVPATNSAFNASAGSSPMSGLVGSASGYADPAFSASAGSAPPAFNPFSVVNASASSFSDPSFAASLGSAVGIAPAPSAPGVQPIQIATPPVPVSPSFQTASVAEAPMPATMPGAFETAAPIAPAAPATDLIAGPAPPAPALPMGDMSAAFGGPPAPTTFSSDMAAASAPDESALVMPAMPAPPTFIGGPVASPVLAGGMSAAFGGLPAAPAMATTSSYSPAGLTLGPDARIDDAASALGPDAPSLFTPGPDQWDVQQDLIAGPAPLPVVPVVAPAPLPTAPAPLPAAPAPTLPAAPLPGMAPPTTIEDAPPIMEVPMMAPVVPPGPDLGPVPNIGWGAPMGTQDLINPAIGGVFGGIPGVAAGAVIPRTMGSLGNLLGNPIKSFEQRIREMMEREAAAGGSDPYGGGGSIPGGPVGGVYDSYGNYGGSYGGFNNQADFANYGR
ncbi:MAG: peptidoglycan DD-metalloendopeptidase family protein [Burkholderiales bacterium]|nr:peptidoglycan DD-metalloendopeptidase family protein [Burkholderiales bacterium]